MLRHQEISCLQLVSDLDLTNFPPPPSFSAPANRVSRAVPRALFERSKTSQLETRSVLPSPRSLTAEVRFPFKLVSMQISPFNTYPRVQAEFRDIRIQTRTMYPAPPHEFRVNITPLVVVGPRPNRYLATTASGLLHLDSSLTRLHQAVYHRTVFARDVTERSSIS